MAKSKAKRTVLTSEEYREKRDKVVDDWESGKVPESVCIKQLQNLYAQRIHLYRNGGDGFVLWAEENVRINAYLPGTSIKRPTYLSDLSREPEPMTGRTWWDFWCWQKEVCREALALGEDGRLKHNLVILCTERGEGKSFMAVLILAWKFTVFADQRIFLAANSKEQSTFAHREELDKFIRMSPSLLALVGGEKRINQKEIAIYDSRGMKISFITTVSTFTGVLSNATGFSFSEFFQSRPEAPFFNDIYTSMRNTPNALGIIDSTVSTRDHKLYELYEQHKNKEKGSENWYFFYKCNPNADISLYKSPANTQKQLDGFRAANAHNPAAFEMFFCNTWNTAQKGLFSEVDIEGMKYLGSNGIIGNEEQVLESIEKLCKWKKDRELIEEKQFKAKQSEEPINLVKNSLISIDKYVNPLNDITSFVSQDEMARLSEVYDTDWAIGIGLDRNDPLSNRSAAQTVLTCIAKGLPGSRSNPTKYMVDVAGGSATDYVYVLLSMYVGDKLTAPQLQTVILQLSEVYSGIESFASDRYGVSDLAGWLATENILKKPEIIHFSQDKQKEVFAIFHNVVHGLKLKTPELLIPGVRNTNILEEQLNHFCVVFDGRSVKYGSDEKGRLHGVQDDAVDSLAMGLYGLRHVGYDQFKPIINSPFFGLYIPPTKERRSYD